MALKVVPSEQQAGQICIFEISLTSSAQQGVGLHKNINHRYIQTLTGQKVPLVQQSVSIVTIGDSFWSQYVQPALTTVQVPMKAVGTRATELLFQSLDEDLSQPQQIVLPTTLIVRDSSKRVEEK